jgi:pectate lyase
MRAAAVAVVVLLICAAAAEAHAQLAAFPGAQGFGAVATGGRGGSVQIVTTLDRSGPGSLAAALAVCEPRIIVFRVSGVIEGDHEIPCGDVTIAGQTAPGAGITIHGRLIGAYDTSVGNLVIRHLRVRPPPLTATDAQLGPQYDAIQLSRQSRVILDHVTVSWSSDEAIDVYEATDVTLQWVTIEESSTAGHPEGEHNYGIINGPDGGRISVHHSLCAHHRNRCPALAVGPAEVIGNVVYDVRHGFVHHNPASGEFHIVGNTFRDGPSAALFPFFFDDEDPGGTAYYLRQNAIDDPGVLTGVVDDIWAQPLAHPTFADAGGAAYAIDAPTDFGGFAVTRRSPGEAYALVLERAGAFPRDVVTRRTIQEVIDRTGSFGAQPPADLMEGLAPGAPPVDQDDDGMADAWETGHGLDPTDGTDHATVMPSGYTAIEEYINGLADGVAPGGGDPDAGDGGGGDDPAGGCCDAGGSGDGAIALGLGVTVALGGVRRRAGRGRR